MKCDECKYAEWLRNSKGHLHPSGQGKCTYYKKVPLPQSMSTFHYSSSRGQFIEIRGGFIERKHELKEPCAYYGATK